MSNFPEPTPNTHIHRNNNNDFYLSKGVHILSKQKFRAQNSVCWQTRDYPHINPTLRSSKTFPTVKSDWKQPIPRFWKRLHSSLNIYGGEKRRERVRADEAEPTAEIYPLIGCRRAGGQTFSPPLIRNNFACFSHKRLFINFVEICDLSFPRCNILKNWNLIKIFYFYFHDFWILMTPR